VLISNKTHIKAIRKSNVLQRYSVTVLQFYSVTVL